MMTERTPIDLVAYRAALHGRDVLLDLLQNPPWLIAVQVVFQDGHPVLVAVVTSHNNEVRCCVPTLVNNFRVVVDARSRE